MISPRVDLPQQVNVRKWVQPPISTQTHGAVHGSNQQSGIEFRRVKMLLGESRSRPGQATERKETKKGRGDLRTRPRLRP